MIKILRFSRELSLFVLFHSIVRSISLIEAKQLYSRLVIIFNHCRFLHPINVLIKKINKKITEREILCSSLYLSQIYATVELHLCCLVFNCLLWSVVANNNWQKQNKTHKIK